MVTIKFEAPKKVVYKRIGEKSKGEQGGGWSVSVEYPDRYESAKNSIRNLKDYLQRLELTPLSLEPIKSVKLRSRI
jgi:hypothetical protein